MMPYSSSMRRIFSVRSSLVMVIHPYLKKFRRYVFNIDDLFYIQSIPNR